MNALTGSPARIEQVILRPVIILLAALALTLVTGPALAHATLVFGELTTSSEPPEPVTGFTMQLHIMDPVRTPIEDAVVAAEFRLMTDAEMAAREAGESGEAPTAEEVEAGEVEVDIPEGDWHIFEMIETGPGGNYAAEITLPETGYYQVIMRDTTYPQEDAVAEILLNLDGETEFGAPLFIFPPTDIGGASLGTWLIWLVAIPVVAGVIVTISVLNTKPTRDGKGDQAT